MDLLYAAAWSCIVCLSELTLDVCLQKKDIVTNITFALYLLTYLYSLSILPEV